MQKYLGSIISVIGDAHLILNDKCRPYRLDIALISDHYPIRIDIEIDEPYSGLSRKPMHYQGCGDDYRDIAITNVGWIVVRFAEVQIKRHPLECVAYIAKLLQCIFPEMNFPDILRDSISSFEISRWTQCQAQQWAKQKYREDYLQISSFYSRTVIHVPTNLTLNQQETTLLERVKPTQKFGPKEQYVAPLSYNKRNSHPRDNEIVFYPDKHLYVYHGLTLTPVSVAIGEFFPAFDAERIAHNKAIKSGCSKNELLDEWSCKGAKAREVGTFLHLQIENYFLNKDIQYDYSFHFQGLQSQEYSIENISAEMRLFSDFIQKTSIYPYRSEWRIYDTKYMIAGTIDMLSCYNGEYEMYDWKRSGKIVDSETGQLCEENRWQSGFGDLEHLPDTSYHRYCLQQNIYRHILKENYNIEVNKMYLVVLHPENTRYYQVKVPLMEKETQYILNQLI